MGFDMDAQLAARAVLRIVAFGLVAFGQFTDIDVSWLYQNADVVALAALGGAEAWFYIKKMIG